MIFPKAQSNHEEVSEKSDAVEGLATKRLTNIHAQNADVTKHVKSLRSHHSQEEPRETRRPSGWALGSGKGVLGKTRDIGTV